MSNDPLQSPEESPNPFARPLADNDPAQNPYAPTVEVNEGLPDESDVESFRRHYLGHEASIKSIGVLYIIPGVLFVGGLVMTIGVILSSMLGEKGKVVFSDAYQEAIRQTPHIKYKTSLAVKVSLAVLIAVILVGVIAIAATA